ncbi:MAG: SPFH domain-containing protein [Oscillospiraceae bacterium]
MGLIKAALGSAAGVLADQWKEYFYCEAIPAEVLAVKGRKRSTGRGSNNGSDNIISNGSVIAVADGQCMMIVEQGKVVDVCSEPGEYTYDTTTEPSLLTDGLNKDSVMAALANVGKRFTFGGEAPMDQRVYYFNTKEVIGNKYGTPSPVPFRVVDERAGIDIDISIRCFGEYSYRVTNPLLFYTNVCGNVTADYRREQIDSQLKSELLTSLQPAFAKISEMGIRYSALPGHTTEMSAALNDVLSAKWRDLRGIEIVSFGVSSVKANEEDEQMIKEMQRNAAFMDPTRAAAYKVAAEADAMKAAASNANGAVNGFMGMGMVGGMAGTGTSAASLFQMGAQQAAQAQQAVPAAPAAPAAGGWKCSCGNMATGKFCTECGSPKPQPSGWTCPSCGTPNTGKFCLECGTKKPENAPRYKCDKCGWEPEDPAHPPKFCPECGDPIGAEDVVK